MTDTVAQQSLDAVLALAGKAEGVITDMAPHIWAAEVSYWRVQGWMALVLPIIPALIAWRLYLAGRREAAKGGFMGGDGLFLSAGLLSVATLVVGGVAIACVAPAAFAPEMYAIRDLIGMLK